MTGMGDRGRVGGEKWDSRKGRGRHAEKGKKEMGDFKEWGRDGREEEGDWDGRKGRAGVMVITLVRGGRNGMRKKYKEERISENHRARRD